MYVRAYLVTGAGGSSLRNEPVYIITTNRLYEPDIYVCSVQCTVLPIGSPVYNYEYLLSPSSAA